MVAHDETSVTLACAVRPQPGYEWQFDLQVIYALNPVGLVVTCRAVNVDRDPAPFGVGFHPMPRTLQALALVSPDLISAAAKAPTGGSRGARVASSSSMKWWLWPKRAEALMRS